MNNFLSDIPNPVVAQLIMSLLTSLPLVQDNFQFIYHVRVLFNVCDFQQFFKIILSPLMQSCSREALVRSFQLAFSLRSISLGGGMF